MPHPHKYRSDRLRLFATLLALVLLAAACATTGDEEAGEQAAPVVQELVVGSPVDEYTLSPPERATVAMFGNSAPVFETLAQSTPDLTVEPLLATSWEFREPGTWRFLLRRGVRFHNGVAFDAQAVVWNINERLAKQGFIPGLKADSAVAVDPFTVDVTPSPVNMQLPEYLTNTYYSMVAPNTHAGAGASADSTPTGTGPFRFVSYQKDRELVVSRWDGYWGTKPTLEKITFRMTPDGNSRVLALKANDVHAILNVPREQIKELEADKSFQIVKSRTGAFQMLKLNMSGEAPYDILADLRVRQAMAYAIDEQSIVDNVWRGGAEVMASPRNPALLGRYGDRIKGYPHDKARARSLLDEAGWRVGGDGVRAKEGRRLQLEMVVYLPDEQRPLPELVQAQLREVGIDMKITVPADTSAYFAVQREGKGDIFSEGAASGIEHPGSPTGSWLKSGSSARIYGISDAYDALNTQLRSTSNIDEQQRLTAEMLRIAMDETVAAINIAGVFRIYGLSAAVDGFRPWTFIMNQKWAGVSLKAAR